MLRTSLLLKPGKTLCTTYCKKNKIMKEVTILLIRKVSLLFLFLSLCLPVSLFPQSHINTLDIQISDFQRGINTTDGKILSYYELKVTNYGFQSVGISKIKRFMGNIELDSIEGELVRGYVVGTFENYSSEVLPGQTIIIFLDVLFESSGCDSNLKHRVEFTEMTNGEKRSIKALTTKLNCSGQTYIASPFKDGIWTAIYSPVWKRGHRRVIYATKGKAIIPGKYAIDFVKVDNKGRQYEEDKNRIENWYSYGETVYNGAAGTVVDIRDDFIEYDLLSEYIYPDHQDAAGNFVIVKTDAGKYIHYEHLKPKSVKVKIGQKIKIGEEIGQVGFTGGTTGPHLHVHVSNGQDFLGSEPIPFGLKRYESIGKYEENGSGLGSEKWEETKPKTVINSRPYPNEVISLEEAAHNKR